MLDLNVVDVVCVDSTCDDNEVRLSIEKLPEDDTVTSSSSSVVNADVGDEHSSSTHTTIPPFNFNTLNKGLQKCNENLVPELITRQLFPLGVGESDEFSSSSRWLNLTVPQLIQPQPQTQPQTQVKKSRRGPRSRSSPYRGVTFYRRTGRWESHIWDSGKQVYLGGFDTAHAAARAYDRAAIKFRGHDADINFTISDYDEDMKVMKNLTKEEFVQSLRRQTTGFSRGSSKYRGVTLHKCGRWEARMDQFLGKKTYDKAAIKCNGPEAFTNFEPSTYEEELGLVAKDGDSGHNLDLNLWISPPPDGPKGNQNAKDLHFHSATYQLPNGKRPKLESSASPMGGQTPYGLTMASMNLPIWPAKYPGFTPDYEERAMGKREAEAVSSQGFSKWAWQLQDHHSMVTSDPLFSSTTTVAASSGFSSTLSPFSNYSHLSLNKTPHNQKN